MFISSHIFWIYSKNSSQHFLVLPRVSFNTESKQKHKELMQRISTYRKENMKYCTRGKVYLYIQSFLKWSLSLSFLEYRSIPGSRAIFIYDWKMIQNATLQEKDQMVGLETRTWFQNQHLKQNNLQCLNPSPTPGTTSTPQPATYPVAPVAKASF